MPVSLSCACGRALKVKDELAGKKIRCPECKDILTVPAEDVLEVVEDDEEAPARGPRRAAIQAAPIEKKPTRRAVEDDEEPLPRKRPRPPRDIRRRTPAVTFERGWFGSVNAGVVGGILMMLIAVVWFVVGLAGGIIFFYPPSYSSSASSPL